MKLWIARDSNGTLFLHDERPVLISTYGYYDSEDSFKLDKEAFPEITFENSPREVELKLIEK